MKLVLKLHSKLASILAFALLTSAVIPFTSAQAQEKTKCHCNITEEDGSIDYANLRASDLACLLKDQVKTILSRVRDNVTPEEWASTWVRIRTKATYAKISLDVNQELSSKTRNSLLNLIKVLEDARTKLESQMTIENQYDDAVELYTICEWLKHKLD